MLAKYQQKQEEVVQLHVEIEAQKLELDMIQECIASKYAPLASLEEKERGFEAAVKELRGQLAECGEQLAGKEEEIRTWCQENEKLRASLLAVQSDLRHNYVLAEKSHETERTFAAKVEDLNTQLRELQQKFAETQSEKERLQEESARQRSEAQEAQSRLRVQYVPVEQVEALKRELNAAMEGLKAELSSQEAGHQEQRQKAEELRRELAHLRGTSIPLAEHTRVKEGLEGEVASAKAALKEKEQESQARGEEVAALQSGIQSAKQSLRELEIREEAERLEHKTGTLRLEGQVASMAERVASLSTKPAGMCEKAVQVKAEELPPSPRGFSIEQEIKDQKERCDKSLSTIVELQERIQESAKQVEAKDNKVSLKAKGIWGCVQRSLVSRSREVVVEFQPYYSRILWCPSLALACLRGAPCGPYTQGGKKKLRRKGPRLGPGKQAQAAPHLVRARLFPALGAHLDEGRPGPQAGKKPPPRPQKQGPLQPGMRPKPEGRCRACKWIPPNTPNCRAAFENKDLALPGTCTSGNFSFKELAGFDMKAEGHLPSQLESSVGNLGTVKLKSPSL
nr:PREDICTED: uveal autoantigen with coiled-coil domains and ankyrin repeats-like [Anolis carolinensis]|eukprot:XP_008121378.1 PREDICTED: uveal autoantigen with coiled-coil domains and ankyrin repeats-like [Anolis carolinensis]